MSEPANDILQQLLAHAVSTGASDIHLSVGLSPYFRIHGLLNPEPKWPSIDSSLMAELAKQVHAGRDLGQLQSQDSLDGALTGPSSSRFRYNIFKQKNALAIALRRLEERIRPLEELGLPTSLYELADLNDGLVIVAGPTGSGKSTTLATLIDRINRNHTGHIVTIEDPIEYLHPSVKSLVNQRQIGIDSPSFREALISSLRQDPDVILVGEIREIETIRTALMAAETGHIVFTTVHAADCVGVIERVTSVFPADEQPGIRRQLALVLKAVIAQQLIVADGPAVVADSRRDEARLAKRVVASEVMRVTPAVANLIASSKSAQIYSAIESGIQANMQTLDQDLARLLVAGMISEQAAVAYAHNPSIVLERASRLRAKPQAMLKRGGRN